MPATTATVHSFHLTASNLPVWLSSPICDSWSEVFGVTGFISVCGLCANYARRVGARQTDTQTGR